MLSRVIDIATILDDGDDFSTQDRAFSTTTGKMNEGPDSLQLHHIMSFLHDLTLIPEEVAINEVWRTVVDEYPEDDGPPYHCALFSVYATTYDLVFDTVRGFVSQKLREGQAPSPEAEGTDDPVKLEQLARIHQLHESVLTFSNSTNAGEEHRIQFGGFGQEARRPVAQQLGVTMTKMLLDALRTRLEYDYFGV